MAALEEPGEVIIVGERQGRSLDMMRSHTRVLSQGSKTPNFAYNTWARVPGATGSVGEGGKIWVEFSADAADIIESEESNWTIPVNVFDMQTGKFVQTRNITMDMFTGFTTAGTVDITCAAGTRVKVAYINIPAGERWRLSVGSPIHLYLGDDT